MSVCVYVCVNEYVYARFCLCVCGTVEPLGKHGELFWECVDQLEECVEQCGEYVEPCGD